MRGRWVKPEEITDELLTELPIGARQLYIWLRNYADDQGLFADSPNEVHLALFPGHSYPVEAWIDLLVATGKLTRMVVTTGRHRTKRVVFVKNFPRHQIIQRPSQPRWGYVADCAPIPVPTPAQRLALIDRYQLPAADSDLAREFPPPTRVPCESCGRAGDLYRFDPLRSAHPEWDGTVAASRLEIIAAADAPDGVAVLCRACRASRHPIDIPPPAALFGGVEIESAAGTPTMEEAAAGDATITELNPKLGQPPSRPRKRTPAAAHRTADIPDGEVAKVFEAWKEHAGKTNRIVLDEKRTRLIRKLLGSYPLDEALLAVEGWKYHPFYNGDTYGRVWSELHIVLRDAHHIEMFRDIAAAVHDGRPLPDFRTAKKQAAAVGDFTGQHSGVGEM